MQTKYFERIKKLPEFVQETLGGDVYVVNEKIQTEYSLTDEDMLLLSDIKAEVLLKDVSLEGINTRIVEDLKCDKEKADGITLILLCEVFYPAKDYFPGIEDEILKLGGEIPKIVPKRWDEQLLKRDEEMEAIQKAEEEEAMQLMADTIINESIESLLKDYPQVGDQQIGNQGSIGVKDSDVPMRPLIKYWLKDYLEKAGYGLRSNLDRVQYVYRDKNTKNMNEEERRQLGLVLKSLDEGIPLPYSTKRGKIDFSKIVEE